MTGAATVDYWRLRPNAPARGHVLCDSDAIAEGGAREFAFGRGRSAFRMFVVRWNGEFRGYLNICPHYALPLNHQPDRFVKDGFIECVQHFARFAIEDGRCVSGACGSEGLSRVPLAVTPDARIAIA